MPQINIKNPVKKVSSKKLKRTHRGFAIYGEFRDSYDASIRIIESSADPLIYCWVYIDGGGITNNDGATHLTVAQARKLIKALELFIKDKTEEKEQCRKQ